MLSIKVMERTFLSQYNVGVTSFAWPKPVYAAIFLFDFLKVKDKVQPIKYKKEKKSWTQF